MPCCTDRARTQGRRLARICGSTGCQGLQQASHTKGRRPVHPLPAGAGRAVVSAAAERLSSRVRGGQWAGPLAKNPARMSAPVMPAAAAGPAAAGARVVLTRCLCVCVWRVSRRCFDFSPSLADYIAAAGLVISHAGGWVSTRGGGGGRPLHTSLNHAWRKHIHTHPCSLRLWQHL
jgi:hypothetical protein